MVIDMDEIVVQKCGCSGVLLVGRSIFEKNGHICTEAGKWPVSGGWLNIMKYLYSS